MCYTVHCTFGVPDVHSCLQHGCHSSLGNLFLANCTYTQTASLLLMIPSKCTYTSSSNDFFVAPQPHSGLGRLVFETARSHTNMPYSVGFLWKSDQPIAVTST